MNDGSNNQPPRLRNNYRIVPPPPPPPTTPSTSNSMLPPPPKIRREKEKDWDDTMSIATSGGFPALSVYETEEEQFRREAILEGKIPSEFELSFKCKSCAICSSKFSTVKEGLEHFRQTHYKKRCPKCFMVFSSTGNIFKDHLTTHFVPSKSRLEHIECTYCVDEIYHYEDLWTHLENEHLSNVNQERIANTPEKDEDLSPEVEVVSHPVKELPRPSDLPQTLQIPNDKVDASIFDNVTVFTQENVLDLCIGRNPIISVSAGSTSSTDPLSSLYPDSDSGTVSNFPIQVRKGFTDEQKRHLIKAFLEDPNHPWDIRAKFLSQRLKCDYQKISVWFKSERHKFVKGSFPMWAKSSAGWPRYKCYLLPGNKLQIVSIESRRASLSRDNSILNEGEDVPENNELSENFEIPELPNDLLAPSTDSNSDEDQENITAMETPRENSTMVTEVVKIKMENDVSRGSDCSSGYESDNESCITKIFPSTRSKVTADNDVQRRASISQETETVANIKVKIEKAELSKKEQAAASQAGSSSSSRKENITEKRRLSVEIADGVEIKKEKGIDRENSCGYESDDSCVTQINLPKTNVVLAAFKQWKASRPNTGKNSSNKVAATKETTINEKSENPPIKIEKDVEENIDSFKRPSNVKVSENIQRKSLDDKSESRKHESPSSSCNLPKEQRESNIDNNFKHPGNFRITESILRKSLEGKSVSKKNEPSTSSYNPPKEQREATVFNNFKQPAKVRVTEKSNKKAFEDKSESRKHESSTSSYNGPKERRESTVDNNYKQPGSAKIAGNNRRKSFEDEYENRSHESSTSSYNRSKEQREATVDSNFKQPGKIRITDKNNRKSFEDKCASRENEAGTSTSSRSPLKRKGGNESPSNRRKSFTNHHHHRSEEEGLEKKRKLNENENYLSMSNSSQQKTKRDLNKNTSCEEKPGNSVNIKRFKIPKLTQSPPNKCKQMKSSRLHLQNDGGKKILSKPPNISTTTETCTTSSKAREFCKPGTQNEKKRPSFSSRESTAPLAPQQQPVSTFPIPLPSNPGPSRSRRPEANYMEIPTVGKRQRQANCGKILGKQRQGVRAFGQPPKKRRRRCGTPIGQILAPVVTTQQLKQTLKQREEKARKEKEERQRQEEIQKRRAEIEKQKQLQEKKDNWEIQRKKYNSTE